MATGKRYYWIKLKEDFMNSDVVDYLMSQRNGANYIVLYLMLCLKTINTSGKLSNQIGEVVIPYDVEKIQRDCKWFSADTIRVAMRHYMAFGLIYRNEDGVLELTGYDDLVGMQTDWSDKKRRQREGQTALPGGDNVPTNVPTSVPANVPDDVPQNVPKHVPANVPSDVPTDIRDIDIRDIDTRDRDKDTRDNRRCSSNSGPCGEGGDLPDFNTLEAYASANLQYLTADSMEELVSFRDQLPDDVIRFAINEACDNGAPRYSYVRAILNRYVDEGVRSVGDAKAAKARFLQRGGAQEYDYGSDDGDPYRDWRNGNG